MKAVLELVQIIVQLLLLALGILFQKPHLQLVDESFSLEVVRIL